MKQSPQSGTCHSVLSGMRVSKDDVRRDECRTRFYVKYGPYLFNFFRRNGLRHHDAEDCAAELLDKLDKRMATFKHNADLSFRAYLTMVAKHALFDFWTMQKQRRERGEAGLSEAKAQDLEEFINAEFKSRSY